MKGSVKRKCLALLSGALMALPASAQYIPSMSVGNPEKQHRASGVYWHPGNTFSHLDLALSVGSTGIGIELASPLCEIAQVRLGYEIMPPFRRKLTSDVMVGNEKSIQYDENGNRIRTNFEKVRDMMYSQLGYDMMDHIDMTGTLTMNNFKFLVDIFPLMGNHNLHVTLGFYWGPSQIAKIKHNSNSAATLQSVSAYNKLYDATPDVDPYKTYGRAGFLMGKYAHDVMGADGTTVLVKTGDDYKMTAGETGEIYIPVKTNAFRPYLGIGYEGNILKKREDLKFAVTGGVVFWGGTPSMITPDGVNLTKDVTDITGKTGSYVDLMSKLIICPAITVRVIKTLF